MNSFLLKQLCKLCFTDGCPSDNCPQSQAPLAALGWNSLPSLSDSDVEMSHRNK